MRRKLPILAIAVALLILATPATALAWSNGPSEGNGYSTHDWVLDEAITMSGVSWVDTDAALLATDDPDTQYASDDVVNHVYRPTGHGRGGPSTVTDYYQLAVEAYAANDMTAASEYLGILSHYYADINVPFHTSDNDPAGDAVHLPYEVEVSYMNDTPGENSDWVDTTVARQPVTNVHERAVAAAYASRALYPSLLSNYTAHGYNSTVDSITQQCLSRAVNDLADIIQAIEGGAGIAPLGTLESVAFRDRIGQNRETGVISTYRDADGNPIEGMRVVNVWYFPGRTVTDIVFTDASGIAQSWENSGDIALGSVFDVVCTTNSGAASAAETVTLEVTDSIGTIKTGVPYYPPMQNTLLTASCLILNEYGEPISGLPVTFTWSHKTGPVTYQTTTNKWGMAVHSRNIGNSAIGYKVAVKAETQSGGSDRSSTANFVPKANTGARTNYTRVWGNDRFSTGAAIAKRAYPGGADTIIVATGQNWPDALGGSALSGAYDAPIILCDTNSLPSSIKTEIKRLGATKAIILGGTASVGWGVEKDLKSVGVKSISRIGGKNRYEAARNVARATISKAGPGYERVAFVSSGATFPDALAASPLAAFRRWPIYLADPSGSPAALASQMRSDGVRKVIVLGGPASVSTSYEKQLRAVVGETIRLGGKNRYDAAATIAQYGVANAGLQYDGVNIASGLVFPDALAGGALANKKRCVMLLTDGKSLSSEPRAVLAANKDEVGTFHFLGGSATVTTNVKNQVIATLE